MNNFIGNIEYLLPVDFRQIPFSGCRRDVENLSADQRPERPFFMMNQSENRNSVKDVEYLLPVKFRQNPFSGCRGEMSRLALTDWPKNFNTHKL